MMACLAHADSAAVVRVDGAWARATPPGVKVGAAFLTLEAQTNDHLLSVTSAVADRVEIHSMKMQNGMMQMRQLQTLDLPAKQRVELGPEGTHLMLLGLKQSLAPRSQFTLQLHFQHAPDQTVTVAVRPVGQ